MWTRWCCFSGSATVDSGRWYSCGVIVHLNGKLVPLAEARVSPFDRGFLFGDALYEGLRAFDGRVVEMALHVRRLAGGLKEARIAWDAARMDALTYELLKANGLTDAFIYWQITRGTPGPGDPVRARIPPAGITPTVFGYCVPARALDAYREVPMKSCITARDTRWHRGHVKSTSLLGCVLASLEADEAGAEDAILVREPLVAEGTSANVLLAIPDGRGTRLVTPSMESVSILAGVTRDILIREVPAIEQRPVHVLELAKASEIVLLGTLTMVTAVTRLDGKPVGAGRVGPEATRLMDALVRAIRTAK